MAKAFENLGIGLAKAGENAAGIFEKAKNAAVNIVDQNGDGKIGQDDFSAIRGAVKSAVKESGERWAEKQEQAKRDRELKELRPFFSNDIEGPGFSLPKLIRIAEMDTKHAESQVCEDSVGFTFSDKDLDIVTIYPDKLDLFDLKFFPDTDSGLYYVDPNDRDYYISLDEYFNYLKVARIGELQKIAQDLGATHFRVVYKEQKKSFSANDAKVNATVKIPVKQGGKVAVDHHTGENAFSKVEIAAEMVCIGHDPVKPKLSYFRKDPQILNLIELRMSNNELKHQTYTLNLSSSCGIKIKDAVKIDAAIKAMKLDGNTTVTSEAQSESRRIFEYEIDF